MPPLRPRTLRTITTTAKSRPGHRRPRVPDESTLAGATHKPSLSMGGASFGHLISELSRTTPTMQRVAAGLLGVPVVLGAGVVGVTWVWGLAD
ncbi:hypothetical protein W97_02417 [Coniosporium apollinis CBS 100218]|uniref:Uncharacterized protein n=1 Tax=Coniosporium apollinis (strain CBS 100218) TaxID=1168221 RepID=R7YMN8_CONA1|nr:uncharacterized protein W97_02417 [Coniosporium apollinis CBS 100218]EON63190.1 hypothetical protein W97_02417 [Coniosporium apollinis CBS 100218]